MNIQSPVSPDDNLCRRFCLSFIVVSQLNKNSPVFGSKRIFPTLYSAYPG